MKKSAADDRVENVPEVPGVWTVKRHLDSKPDAILVLYNHSIARVEACGPIHVQCEQDSY